MYKVVIHEDVKADAATLFPKDPVGFEWVFRFIESLDERPDLVGYLLKEGYEDNVINVDAVTQLMTCNVFRLKVKGLDLFFGEPDEATDASRWMKYRILYAPQHKLGALYILAVVVRSDDTYDPKNPRNVQLVQTCGRLGLSLGTHRLQ